MSELLNAGLPWWIWTLIILGVLALVGVLGALFLPDWTEPDYQLGTDAEAGSEAFVDAAAALLNNPVYRGGKVDTAPERRRVLSGDAGSDPLGDATTSTFEVYIFEPDEIGRRFMDAFIDRARAGVEVRFLVDWFGSWKFRRAASRRADPARE